MKLMLDYQVPVLLSIERIEPRIVLPGNGSSRQNRCYRATALFSTQETPVPPKSKREYLEAIRARYAAASRPVKSQLLTEVCATTGYHRKAAIRVFTRPPHPGPPRRRVGRPSPYGPRTLTVLMHIWEAAGYPWSVRPQALALRHPVGFKLVDGLREHLVG